MHYACHENQLEMVQHMVKTELEVIARDRDHKDGSHVGEHDFLIKADRGGGYEKVTTWLVKANLMQSAVADRCKTPLQLANELHNGVILAQLARKLDPNISPDKVMGRPIIYYHRLYNVNTFIEAIVRIAKDDVGFTVDDIERRKKIDKVVTTMHKVAKMIESQDLPAFIMPEASIFGDDEDKQLEMVIGNRAGNIKDWKGMTPIFYASSSEVIEAMMQLKDLKLEIINPHEDPLLWKCAERGLVSRAVAEALLEQLGQRNRRTLPIEIGRLAGLVIKIFSLSELLRCTQILG